MRLVWNEGNEYDLGVIEMLRNTMVGGGVYRSIQISDTKVYGPALSALWDGWGDNFSQGNTCMEHSVEYISMHVKGHYYRCWLSV